MTKSIADGPVERYAPRAVTALGVWTAGPLEFKVYALVADGQTVTEATATQTKALLHDEVMARADAMGDSNNLGFVIIHPGTLGISISCHWWVQGSVLCQYIFRQLYGVDQAVDTGNRPVIGCVWELEIVTAEHVAWRRHMMGEVPDPDGYLADVIPA